MSTLEELVLAALTGHGAALPVMAFLALALLVFFAASRLAAHADAIADATGLGRVWIGALLLAASTSLPELATDVNAALLGSVDIGVGDLFGSTLANMLVLAVLDIAYARRRVLQQVAADQMLLCALAIAVTTIATTAIATRGFLDLGRVGLETVLIVALYAFGMRGVYLSTRALHATPEQLTLGETSRTVLSRSAAGFGAGAAALLLLAPALVVAARAVAVETGLSETAVGTILVGFTTSLPEIAATVAAARMGAFDLAVGNLFGSNAFNMCVLFAMDIAYSGGPVLASISMAHIVTGQAAVFVLALGLMATLARTRGRAAAVRIESLAIVGTYLGVLWLLVE